MDPILRTVGADWFRRRTLVAAALSAAVLASYVPRRGLRPDLGCTPCSALSVLTVLGGILAVASYGASFLGPLVAAAVTLFGLTQRLGQVQACAPAQVKSDSPT